jgi:SAM-dependent methyltransferase
MAIKNKNSRIRASIQNRPGLNESIGPVSGSDSGQDEFGELIQRGITAINQGHNDEAIQFYQDAIALNPMAPELYYNIGVAHNNAGRSEAAIIYYRKAINLKPDFTGAYNNMGYALLELNRPGQAVACFRKNLDLKPSNRSYWHNFIKALSKIPLAESARYYDDYQKCLTKEGIHLGPVQNHLIALVKQHQDFPALLASITHVEPESMFDSQKTASAFQFLNSPILTGILATDIVVDPLIEKLLTGIRKIITGLTVDNRFRAGVEKILLKFTFSLAHQCFINEYVYFQSEEEKIWIDTLYRRLTTGSAPGQDDPVFILSLLAAYAPLDHYEKLKHKIEALAKSEGNSDFNLLVQRQLTEPATELALLTEINPLTRVADKVSQAVRNQYEENPYPRWISAPHIKERKLAEEIVSLFPQLDKIGSSIPDSPRILIAGCGTGLQAVICALRYSNSHILAIDISQRSLTYAMRKVREMKIGNIEFAHGDILELGQKNTCFDVILSTGVLHHLSDPVEGLRILTNLLIPGGFFYIGLYSKIARRHIIAAQEFIAERGYGCSADGIRKCRQDILRLDERFQLKKIAELTDFYSLSMCRDLLFHVQEHCFNLIQIKEAIEDVGLEFLGFEISDSDAIAQYKSNYDSDPEATSLELWHRYEMDHPDLFLGMYQLWTRKNCTEKGSATKPILGHPSKFQPISPI